MPKAASPYRHPATGIYYLRRRVPKGLEDAFPIKNGIVMRSLHTKSATEAAQLFPAANADLEAEFAELRQSTGSWPAQQTVRRSLLDSLVTKVVKTADATVRDDFRILLLMNGFAFDAALETEGVTPALVASSIPPKIKDEVLKGLAEQVQNLRHCRPIPVGVRIELMQVLEERLPDFVREWSLSVLPRSAGHRKFEPPVVRHDPDITLAGLKAIWAENRKPKSQTVTEAERVISDFVETFGDIPAREITSADLLYFKEQLLGVPKNLSNTEAKLSLAERVACAEKAPENGSTTKRPLVSDQTVAKKMSLLKAILGVKGRDGQAVLQHNPALGFGTGHKWDGEKRDQLKPSEAAAFFSLPIFTQPTKWQSERMVSDMTLAWLGILGLVSSCRLGEIAQLRVADIIVDGTRAALDITDYVENGVEGEKSVKTASSRRVIVLPRSVLELGFLDYERAVRQAGHSLLFPDLLDRRGQASAKEGSRRLNQLLDEITAKRNVAFHSLRHNWKASARRAKIDPELHAQLSGHASITVGGKYGKAFMDDLADAIDSMEFQMIPWSTLTSAWAGISWTEEVAKAHTRPRVRAR